MSDYQDLLELAQLSHEAGDGETALAALEKANTIKQLAEAPSYQRTPDQPTGSAYDAVVEPIKALTSRAVTGFAGALAAPVASAFVGPQRAKQLSADITDLGYEPKTVLGGAVTSAIMEPVSRVAAIPGKVVGAMGGSPDAVARADILTGGVAALTGLKGAAGTVGDALASRTAGKATSESVATQEASQPKTVAQNLAEGKFNDLAPVIQPNKTIADASARTGIELPVAAISDNPTVQAIHNVFAKPGTGLHQDVQTAWSQINSKLDEQIGPLTDKSVLDRDVKLQTNKDIQSTKSNADANFANVRQKIGDDAEMPATASLRLYRQELAKVGGRVEDLDPAYKALGDIFERQPKAPEVTAPAGSPEAIKQRIAVKQYKSTQAQGPSNAVPYGRLDDARRSIGQGFNGRGVYANASDRATARAYDALRTDQLKFAQARGVGGDLSSAWEQSSRYLDLQRKQNQIYGRDQTGSLNDWISSAARGLTKGDVSDFNSLMQTLPQDFRQQAAVSVVQELARPGAKSQSGTQFADAWHSLSRNQNARLTLLSQLPTDVATHIDDLATLSQALTRLQRTKSNASLLTELNIQQLEKPTAVEKTIQVAKKLPKIGAKVAAAEAVGQIIGMPGAGSAAVLAKQNFKDIISARRSAAENLRSTKLREAMNKK